MTKTVNTNSKQFLATVKSYILDCINSEDREFANDTEKLQYLADQFKSSYLNEYNLKQYGSYQNVFAEWCKGLPSCFNLDYENYRIIELAKEWGSLPANADDRQEDKILDNWFNFMAFKTFQLMRKHNVNPY